jgi:hypothetical protein
MAANVHLMMEAAAAASNVEANGCLVDASTRLVYDLVASYLFRFCLLAFTSARKSFGRNCPAGSVVMW